MQSQISTSANPKSDREKEKESGDEKPTTSRESSPQKGLSALALSAFSAHASAVKASTKPSVSESPVSKTFPAKSSLFSAVDLSTKASTTTPKHKSSDSGVDLSKKKKVIYPRKTVQE